MNLIKRKDFEISHAVDKASQDIIEFDQEFEMIDLIVYNDQSSTYRKLGECKNKLTELEKNWKFITERKLNNKKLDMKDFELVNYK